MQWNSQSLLHNKYVFKKFLHDNYIHIALISETWLKPRMKFNIRGYTVVRNDCGNDHNGVAIILHNSLYFQNVSTVCDDSIQNIAVKVQINNKFLTIVSFYSPPNCTPRFTKSKFNNFIKSLSHPMIVAGDFNAHHTVWGCDSVDSRGRALVDVMEENDLVLLNDGNPTTIGSNRSRPNGLDLTMVSSSLGLSCDWLVCDSPLGGYHLPTVTKYTFSCVNYIPQPHTRSGFKHINPKLVDWNKYKHDINELLSGFIINFSDPIDSYNRFCKTIFDVASRSVFRITTAACNSLGNNGNQQGRVKKNFLPLPWWNEKCSRAVDNCRQAFIAFKLLPSEENFIAFKRLQALKKVIIRNESRAAWEEFCNSISRLVPMNLVFEKMRKFNRRFVPNKRFLNSQWLEDFLCKYTPDTVEDSIPSFALPSSHHSFLIDKFTIVELNAALTSRKDTTSGLDGLTYKMFKLLNPSNLQTFLNILNLLWQSNLIPREWKIDCLVPILKSEKDPNSADSYRPITLSSCVGKIFEQLLKQRLEFFIESNHILPSNQFGFRRGRSARESLSHLFLDLDGALHENKILVAVFLDIVGAFNNVNLHVLSSVLASLCIPEKFINWIFSFLHAREIFVKFNNSLFGSRFSYKGVSQGGILSPILFILYIHRLNMELGPHVRNLQFADDLVVYCSGDNITEINNKLNSALSGLKSYFDYLNLNVSYEKSKVIAFHTNLTRFISIVYDGHQLPKDTSIKFLGVTFQNNFKWNKYVELLSDRALKACNILKSLAGTYWGSDPKILLTLYKSLVRSHFEYGFICYSHKLNLVEKLEKIQNRCLRIVMGAMISTPIISMQVEANVPPLLIRFKFLKIKFLLKLCSISSHSLITKLNQAPYQNSSFLTSDFSEILNLKSNYNLYENISLPCYGGSYLSKFCYINIVIDNELRFKEDVYNKLSEFIGYHQVYTDGAKNSESVSMAFYDLQTKRGVGYKLPEAVSIYTAESSAILAALEYIEQQDHDKWVLVTDSQSVLKALDSPKYNAGTNYIIHMIRDKYFQLSHLQQKKIVLFWTPSHVGVHGNDSADFLARSITTSSPDVSVAFKQIPIPESDLLTMVKSKLAAEFKALWDAIIETKGKWYAEISHTICKPWFSKGEYSSRKFFTTICRLRFGHCRFGAHLHRIHIIASPDCTYCNSNDPETLHHVFFDCPSFALSRIVFIDRLLDIYKIPEDIPRSLPELLGNRDCFKPIYEYIISTVGDI